MQILGLLRWLSALLLVAFCTAQVNPGTVTGSTNVHDPTMCKDSSGTYFVYSTGVGIEVRTSTNRVAWTYRGLVWPNGASWTATYTGSATGSLWAPDCYYSSGVFHLYYAASAGFGSPVSGIFYATSSTGLPGSFTNLGLVTSSGSNSNYNAIDPNLFVDGSTWYLSLGSFWTGIKLETVSSSTGLSTSGLSSIAQRTANSGAVEASALWKSGSFYYLFTSWDNCCAGTSSTYNIRVGRSTSPTGGFVDQAGVALTAGGGTLVLGTHGSIVGPGGQDIFADSDGTLLVYHYYTSSGSFLGINKLDFSSGWPVVV